MGSHYSHLTFEECRKIDKWHDAKMPVPEIADRLGRAPSSIYRELKRNVYEDTESPELSGYYSMTAQTAYERRRAIHRKLIAHPDLKAAMEDRLKAGWSPEQIAGRMRLERHPIRVSHETIYASPTRRTDAPKPSIGTSPSIANAADRADIGGTNAPTSSTARA